MRVSEALDSGSIPDEATTFDYNRLIIKLENVDFSKKIHFEVHFTIPTLIYFINYENITLRIFKISCPVSISKLPSNFFSLLLSTLRI
jgi:hypothetical protein